MQPKPVSAPLIRLGGVDEIVDGRVLHAIQFHSSFVVLCGDDDELDGASTVAVSGITRHTLPECSLGC
jgi:hypothetical protein